MELNEEVRISHRRRSVESGGGSAMTVAIAWGDLAAAYASTGIPNIETYASMPVTAAIASRALDWARPVLGWGPIQALLRRLADRSRGPSAGGPCTGRARLSGAGR